MAQKLDSFEVEKCYDILSYLILLTKFHQDLKKILKFASSASIL